VRHLSAFGPFPAHQRFQIINIRVRY